MVMRQRFKILVFVFLLLSTIFSCEPLSRKLKNKSPFSDCASDYERSVTIPLTLGGMVTVQVNKNYHIIQEDASIYTEGYIPYPINEEVGRSDTNFLHRDIEYKLKSNNLDFAFAYKNLQEIVDSTSGVYSSINGVKFDWKRYRSNESESLFFSTQLSNAQFLLIEIGFAKKKDEELCEFNNVINAVTISE